MSSVMRLAGLAFVGALVVPVIAQAEIAWVPSSGGSSLFTYSDGYNSNGFFGSPVLVGNTFVFTPVAFTAVNPAQSTRTDTLQVTIQARPGQTITGIIVREFGIRTSTALTTVQGTMFIKDLTDPNLPQLQNSMTYVNDTTVTPIAWSGTATRTGVSFGNSTPIQLALTDNLAALIGGQSITKTRVEIEILPSPAGAGVLAGAGLLAVARRRRN